MAGSAGALDPFVAEEVEVPLCRMVDSLVHNSAGQCIAVFVLVIVHRKEPDNQSIARGRTEFIVSFT